MHLIVYSQSGQWAEQRLKKAIDGIIEDSHIHICNSLNGFVDQFRICFGSPRIGIVAAQSLRELNEILLFKNVLRKIWSIIILPDRNPSTIAKAYRLWPRYITDYDSDFSDISGILTHIKRRWLFEGSNTNDNAGDVPAASDNFSYLKNIKHK